MLPLDVVLKDTLYRIDVRQFNTEHLGNGAALGYVREGQKPVVFLLNPKSAGVELVKSTLEAWVMQKKAEGVKGEGKGAIVLSREGTMPPHRWHSEIELLKEQIGGSFDEDVGCFFELSLEKKGETADLLRWLLCGGGQWLASMRERQSKESLSEGDDH